MNVVEELAPAQLATKATALVQPTAEFWLYLHCWRPRDRRRRPFTSFLDVDVFIVIIIVIIAVFVG
jgi:hypothetical protein